MVTLVFAAQSNATGYVIDGAFDFQTADCWTKRDSKARTECAWLKVPEDWAQPGAQHLRLPVVIFNALAPDPSLHPVIYLSGGPGYPALGFRGGDIAFWRQTADLHFPGRTLIIFDQRGTGLGSPNLDCDDGDGSMTWYPVSANPEAFIDIPSRVKTAYAACAARHLAAGRRLSAFNSVQSATDVEALRRALELQRVVLFGISYGTRLALTVMKLYPENIDATILDSVFPPPAIFPEFSAKTFGAVLDRLFQACALDQHCAKAYPDLRDRFLRLLAQLEKQPHVVQITNLENSGPRYVRVDDEMFLSVLHHNLYDSARLSWLPALIADVTRGEESILKNLVEAMVDNYRGFPDAFDMGATLAVTCNDYASALDRRPLAEDLESHPYLEGFVMSNLETWPCAIWPTIPDTLNREAVVSDIPSLLLAGGLDPSTTVEQAEMAAETLRNSQLFVFPANGHVQIRNNPCAWTLIEAFLSAPSRRLDPACMASLRTPSFITFGDN